MRRLRQIWYSLVYVVWLAWQVPLQTLRLGRDVFSPGLSVSPSIVEFPLRARTTFEAAAMESSITITPGTLTLGIVDASEDRPKSLFVHFLYAHTHETAVAELEDMESRLLRATRGCATSALEPWQPPSALGPPDVAEEGQSSGDPASDGDSTRERGAQ